MSAPNEWGVKRAKAVADARAIVDKADAEKRDISTEEEQRFDAFMAEAESLEKKIERGQRLSKAEDDLNTVVDEMIDADDGTGEERDGDYVGCETRRSHEYEEAFLDYVSRGNNNAQEEFRAMQVDNDVGGGMLIPSRMYGRILQNVDNLVMMRKLATVIPLTESDSLGVISLDNDLDDAEWTSELGAPTADNGVEFGKRELKPIPLMKEVTVGKKLLRLHPSVATFIEGRIAQKHAKAKENGYMVGTGVRDALGIFTASDQGISTSRDISTGSTTSALTFDSIIEAYFELNESYAANASWIFHRSTKKMLAKLKDGNDHYHWEPSVKVGEPDMLYGHPCYSSRYAPNTYSASQYVGVFGDFSNYYIAESQQMTIQRLIETHARTKQVGFLSYEETDGMPVLEEAFVRLQLASGG